MTMGTGGRITEQLSIGLLAQVYPMERVSAALEQTKRTSERVRDLPAEVVTYYVMGLGLFMAVSTREVLRVILEGLQWLGGGQGVKVAGKAAISQARTRLGVEPPKATMGADGPAFDPRWKPRSILPWTPARGH